MQSRREDRGASRTLSQRARRKKCGSPSPNLDPNLEHLESPVSSRTPRRQGRGAKNKEGKRPQRPDDWDRVSTG